MPRIQVIAAVGLLAAVLVPHSAPAAIPWTNNLGEAQQIAQHQQRLLLLHFYADWCSPCRRLEREVFPRPEVAAAITANYIPVKIDAEKYRDLARQYEVDRFPTDVICDPSGRVLARTVTPPEAGQYIQLLNQVATSHRAAHPNFALASREQPSSGYGSTAGGPGANEDRWQPPAGYASVPATALPDYGKPYAGGIPPARGADHMALANRSPQWSGPAPVDTQPYAAAAAGAWIPPYAPAGPGPGPASDPRVQNPQTPGAVPASTVALGLDGFCPATLAERDAWEPGDRRWGAIHRGRTYLFASEAHQQRFLADPDRYSPVLSGFDPTRFVDRGEAAMGSRSHGMWFRGKMYLFTDEGSLERFRQAPEYYAQKSLEVMMRGQLR